MDVGVCSRKSIFVDYSEDIDVEVPDVRTPGVSFARLHLILARRQFMISMLSKLQYMRIHAARIVYRADLGMQ